MELKFKTKIANLAGGKILNVEQENKGAGVWISLEKNAKVYSGYWRLLRENRQNLSSFDQDQLYGLATPRNAIKELYELIVNKVIKRISYLEDSGDIELIFEDGLKLQIFNFTGFEVWEVVIEYESEYSNYN